VDGERVPGPEENMFGRVLTSNLGRVLGTLLVIGVAGSTVTYGTFANFTAQTSNTGNTFSTGTLALNNVTSSQSTCLTVVSGVNNVSPDCNAIIALANTPGMAPGGTVQSAQVGIYNRGTLPISQIKLYADTCSYGDNPGVTDATQRGAGNPCPVVNISVKNDTQTSCIVGAASTCVPTSTVSGGTLGTFPTSTTTALSALATALPAGQGVTYTFSVQVDPSAGNDVMGRIATTTFRWQATQ
jgi:hypothetical protein